MKKFELFLLTVGLILVQCIAALSQVSVSGTETLLEKLRLNSTSKAEYGVSYANMEGDPFLFKAFTKGKLLLTDGKTFNINVRFDVYANRMHLKVKDEIFEIIHPENISLIEADSLKFIYSKFVKTSGEESFNDFSYFIIACNGPCQLLLKKHVRIQDAVLPQLYQDAKPAKFIFLKDSYYLKCNNQSAVRIRNKRELLEVLGDQKEKINNFLSSNRLDVKDIKDLSRIVEFYNKL